MKIVAYILWMCLPACLFAQGKCDYEFDRVDDFSKERAVSSEFSRIYIHGKGKHTAASIMSYAMPGSGIDGNSARKEELFFSACNIGGKNLLCLKVRSTDSRSTFFNQKYMLLLVNGAIVNLWRIDIGKSGTAVSFTSDAGWTSYLLGVDKKGWSNLKASGVKKIRMPEDKYNHRDIVIDPKNAYVIQSGIDCIEALHIKNVTYEKDMDGNETTSSNSSAKENKSESIPSALLNSKWHSKFSTNAGKKEIEVESTSEYMPNNEVVTETISIVDGKKTISNQTCRFEIANGGKYIIYYYEKGSPQSFEIVALENNGFITKNSVTGKVYIHYKL